MSSRNRVEERAAQIYEYLSTHLGTRCSINELCARLGFHDGSTTRSAIKRAREMATEAGYHFPPAVPQNEFSYMVTNLAEDAIDPTIQMSRIETGVRRTKETGIEFMRRERHSLPDDLKPVVEMHLTVHDATKKALGAIQKAADDMVVELVKARRAHRKDK